MIVPVKVKKLHPDATTPRYATDGAACFDLHALDDGTPHPNDGHAVHYRTGLAFEVPAGWVMLIHSRSGHGFNSALRLSNCTGVIDSDYRGEVMVSVRFDASGDRRSTKLRAGDRIAQAMILPIHTVELIDADTLSVTERGEGGFGSTGA
jgi:dUTP pyrophosphatase